METPMPQSPDGSAVPEHSPDVTVIADPRPYGPPPQHPVHAAPHVPRPYPAAPPRRNRLMLWIGVAAAVLVAATLAIVLPVALGDDAAPSAPDVATAALTPSPTADLAVRDLFKKREPFFLDGGTDVVFFDRGRTRDDDDCADDLIPYTLTGCEHLLSAEYESRDGRYQAVVTVLDFADAGEASAAAYGRTPEGVSQLPDGEHWMSAVVIGPFVVTSIARLPGDAAKEASALAGGLRYKIELNLREAADI